MSSASAAPNPSQPQVDYRLPTDIKPTHYDLTVRTDLKESKFDGVVKIDLDVKKETSNIVFNTSELKLDDVILYFEGSELVPASYSFDSVMERGTLAFSTPLPTGSKAQLKIAFSGELTGAMLGYYRSIGGEDGKEIYALTQFEPTAARRAFPCWDEPLLKATYAVTLISRADTVNLSNMPAASETVYEPGSTSETGSAMDWLSKKLSGLTTSDNADEWKVTRFETTPPMSTYLVAYANGRFAHLESSYKSPLSGKVRPLRIYATSDVIHQAQFALDVKRQVLPLYEQVFDIEYPLPKLDTLVASDFDSGAMENWGLITGRTRAFLLDPHKADLNAKKLVASTQSHEVAHMWFGDITTMEWWDNLYLNEGFATLTSKCGTLSHPSVLPLRPLHSRIFPEWKLHSGFISDALSRALLLDSKLSSHPIEVECPDANMVNQIFDLLSYQKAASVLRMLAKYVGEDRFLKGVSIYLKKHLYKNSVTKDLWEGIGEATGLDIPKMMDNWVKKMGFPVVTIKETKDGIRVRQDRFLETGPAKPKDNETIWAIPLSLLTVSDKGEVIIDKELVLDEREMTIPVDTTKPFKLNAGTVGFYRVLYTPERLSAIGQEAAKSPSPFSVEDRIGVVYDALALAKAGFSEVSSALSLIEILRDEREYLVWESVAGNLAQIIDTWWEHPHIVDALNAFRRELFVPIVKRLGYEYSDDESVDVREMRTMAITQAAVANDESVIKELTSRFAHYMKTGDDSNIPADLERVTYSMTVKHGGREEWDAIRQIAIKPKTPSAHLAAAVAMGNVQDLELAQATWDHSLTQARDQDLTYYIAGLSRNFKTRNFLIARIKEHYEALYQRLAGNFAIQYIVEYAFNPLATDKDYDETAEFFKGKDVSKFDMSLKQTLENIHARSAWIKRSTTDIEKWLKSRQNSGKL
ncbi:hypothetical protein AcV5_005768 [Taiwanofungus camphoratus]|nr:hypothetical protein AcV5_005768 [Antrodia cinnamomea]